MTTAQINTAAHGSLAAPRLNSEDALGVYDRALDWVVAHLPSFHPDHPHVAAPPLRVKPFIELVFVLNPFLRRGLQHLDPRLRQLQSFIAATFEQYDFAAFAQQDPAGLIVFALRDEFRLLSGEERAPDGLLQKYLNTGLPAAVARSRVPYRAIDLLYTIDRAALRFDAAAYLNIWPDTVLARRKPLVRCTDHDLYSITHTLFYLSDLGARSLAELLPDIGALQAQLTAALGMTLRLKNADLAGEFLMCLGFLGAHASPVAELAWSVLAGLQLPCGAVPAPSYRSARDSDPAAEYHFVQSYHTTLVMLGAALPTVQAGRAA